MSKIAIKVENLSKAYQLGQFNTGALAHDLKRWWALKRGKEDPFLTIGETNDRTIKSDSNIVWSLKDINFKIEQGDAVGIIGRNGAGKSTLLKLLSSITSPTSGEIKIKGRIASLLEVGTGFHPELSGRENIFLNGAILGMRKREIKRKFDEIVNFSGVERYIDTPVKRYSSGMYVRLAFAVAAHLESEILIVDEVLAVGDAEFQKMCLGKMDEVSKGEGRTVLFVSHNMRSVQQLCPRVILLENGTVLKQGNSADIINNYLISNNKKEKNVLTQKNGVFVTFSLTNIQKTEFTTGDDIVFNFNAHFEQPFKDICFNVVISNQLGNVVTAIFGREQVKEDINVKTMCDCVITWYNNFLAPGIYDISISIYSKKVLLASWDNVETILVVESDFFATGKIPMQSDVINVLPKCSWKINAN